VEPRDLRSAHRPWTKPVDELELVLASRKERTLSKALTFSYGGTKYCVNMRGPGTAMRGGKVLVHRLVDGRLHVTYKERVLALTAYGTYPYVGLTPEFAPLLDHDASTGIMGSGERRSNQSYRTDIGGGLTIEYLLHRRQRYTRPVAGNPKPSPVPEVWLMRVRGVTGRPPSNGEPGILQDVRMVLMSWSSPNRPPSTALSDAMAATGLLIDAA
jgi:hypothetical protein